MRSRGIGGPFRDLPSRDETLLACTAGPALPWHLQGPLQAPLQAAESPPSELFPVSAQSPPALQKRAGDKLSPAGPPSLLQTSPVGAPGHDSRYGSSFPPGTHGPGPHCLPPDTRSRCRLLLRPPPLSLIQAPPKGDGGAPGQIIASALGRAGTSPLPPNSGRAQTHLFSPVLGHPPPSLLPSLAGSSRVRGCAKFFSAQTAPSGRTLAEGASLPRLWLVPSRRSTPLSGPDPAEAPPTAPPSGQLLHPHPASRPPGLPSDPGLQVQVTLTGGFPAWGGFGPREQETMLSCSKVSFRIRQTPSPPSTKPLF